MPALNLSRDELAVVREHFRSRAEGCSREEDAHRYDRIADKANSVLAAKPKKRAPRAEPAASGQIVTTTLPQDEPEVEVLAAIPALQGGVVEVLEQDVEGMYDEFASVRVQNPAGVVARARLSHHATGRLAAALGRVAFGEARDAA